MAKKRASNSDGVGGPIGSQQLEAAAKAALSMVKTIVESLPIKGEARLKSDINVIDQWFQSAGEDYTTFERIRNPERLPWPGIGLGTYHVEAPSSKAVAHFHELCRAMARICESYQWQGISDDSRRPHSMQRYGTALIPEVNVAFVRSVAIAAQGLVEDLNPTDTDGRQWVEKLESRPAKSVAMTEQELCDMLKAKFDQINLPQAARDLKTVCFDAAETQWTAQKQFESLHLFDAPRCALSEPQLANEWFKLNSLGWSINLPHNTVVEALARDQLERLRASLVEMLSFLKPRVADVSGWPTLSPADLRTLFDIEQDALVKRLKSQAIPNLFITTKSYRVDPSALPDDWKRTLRRG